MSTITGSVPETTSSPARIVSWEMLKGKKTLVTGASRGIGRAAAIALAEAGADVAVNYQASFEAAKEVCGQLRHFGVRSRLYQADVASPEAAQDMIAKVMADFGRIDILVNNAGITRDISEAGLEAVKGMTPLGRLGTPAEVAAAIVFLAAPAASYVTGQVLAVNGGMYM